MSIGSTLLFVVVAFCRFPPVRHLRQRGFTILELMIVVAIIGTLAAIAIPNYFTYIDTARNAVAISTLRQIDRQANDFFMNNNVYPNNLAQIGCGNLRDPWGNPYQYLNIQTVSNQNKKYIRKNRNLVPVNNDYDLYSMGADGKSQAPFTAKASQDDLVRAEDGAFFGRVADY